MISFFSQGAAAVTAPLLLSTAFRKAFCDNAVFSCFPKSQGRYYFSRFGVRQQNIFSGFAVVRVAAFIAGTLALACLTIYFSAWLAF